MMGTTIAEGIQIADGEKAYDVHCKRILSEKEILAYYGGQYSIAVG